LARDGSDSWKELKLNDCRALTQFNAQAGGGEQGGATPACAEAEGVVVSSVQQSIIIEHSRAAPV
jgi:hypothetical protein